MENQRINKKWNYEEKEILIKYASENTNKQLQEKLSQIGSVRTISSIQNQKVKLGLKCSFNAGRFKTGNIPYNKGKKWNDYMSKEKQKNSMKTTFKKGNIPSNRRECFEERVTKDGYIEIKIQDGKLNKNWMLKHRYIYEQHYGKIPLGYNVMFADKNKKNFDIDNLILVSKSEDLIMNQNKLIFEDKNLTKTGYLIAKTIDRTQKLKKEI